MYHYFFVVGNWENDRIEFLELFNIVWSDITQFGYPSNDKDRNAC